ncbi:helix-turn-helix domain-containing protein [Jeotgalibacillus terrae]|uniref:Helix-turn-helix domain-containing protein n=1 Tax=Jeotgalibacillus terrae TaxID=587735 RepID=A0ABW5ZCS2_9BACL|nr:helix-turn-helix transcriptional regulator [Jeotgalibacillus terrae]MBM7577909.1 transcriptional regulator with XRE-family HTH domain [Jeotgalibacillus terrae]
MSLAHILKYYREEVLQISQKNAAYQLNIQPATLSNYERGVRQIPIDTLRRMKDIYHIDDDKFMAMVLYETTDTKVIKESRLELSERVMKAEDRQLIDFLRTYPALLDELRTLSQMPSAKQANKIEMLMQLLRVVKKNGY